MNGFWTGLEFSERYQPWNLWSIGKQEFLASWLSVDIFTGDIPIAGWQSLASFRVAGSQLGVAICHVAYVASVEYTKA